MQTLTPSLRNSQKQTLLNTREQAEVKAERVQLELLWSTASTRFNRDYKAFLSLKVDHSRQVKVQEGIRRQSSLHFKMRGTISQPLFLNLPKPDYVMPPALMTMMEQERPIFFNSETPSLAKMEKEELLNLHLESANRSLENAAKVGLRACTHIMTVLYQAYGGTDRIAFPGDTTGRQLVSPAVAAQLVSRVIDHKLFNAALTSAVELERLSSTQSSWMRPDLRKECIGLAIQRLLNQIAARF